MAQPRTKTRGSSSKKRRQARAMELRADRLTRSDAEQIKHLNRNGHNATKERLRLQLKGVKK